LERPSSSPPNLSNADPKDEERYEAKSIRFIEEKEELCEPYILQPKPIELFGIV
jgi:hypothetical protein